MDWKKRALGGIIQSAKVGDSLIFSEVSRDIPKVSVSAIGRMMKVDRKTVSRYIERHLSLYSKKNR